ncbi:MAG: Ig-like domain-containing protein [Pacificibacter sp.]
MKVIDFVVSDGAGALQRGLIQADEPTTTIQATSDQEISLNLRQADMQGHARDGDALNIVLADGRVIIIENYFNDNGDANRLFISADGYLNEVAFVETTDDEMFAQYGPTEQWGKWSPSDDLIYLGRTDIADAAIALPDNGNEVSMLAPLALLGGGGLGAGAAAAAAGVAGVAALGAGGGGDTPAAAVTPAVTPATPAVPTVNNPTSTPAVGGPGNAHELVVAGTGVPGDQVVVTIGGETATTTIGGDGTWNAVLNGGNFPSDGVHPTTVVVNHQGGGSTNLSGPTFTIDTTPPVVAVTGGAGSNGEVYNSDELQGGATLTGTGEAGAALTVTVGTHVQTTTVDGNGNWSVTYPSGTFQPGEYSETLTIVATDSFGNSSTTTDTFVIDTVSEVAISTSTAGGDGTINNAEQGAGVTLTGSAQPGSTVNVTFGNTTLPATVAANGSWSVDFPSSAVATGETTQSVTAVATDANGNSSTATGSVQIDTLVNSFNFTSTAGGADGVINAIESQAGLIVTGQVEPGSTVQIALGGATATATVAANGSWTATFGAGQLPTGTQTTTMTATATDAAGNSSSIDQTVVVDTEAGALTISSAPVEGDDIVNKAEAADGVVLRGTADANAIVNVTMDGTTHAVVANSSGQWQAPFAASEIRAGVYTANISATTTDAAGNSRTATDSVQVDTRVDNLSVQANIIETDNVISGTELNDGVVMTGTTEPGSTLTVTMSGGAIGTPVTVPATVDANGNWTANFSATQIPQGEYTANVTVNATDAAGNTASATDTVKVDTIVNTLNQSSAAVEGDNVVNAAEASDGISLSGMVEAGSTVMVNFHGTVLPATVDAAGNWSIDIPATAIPSGTYDANITVTATDAVGNVDTINDTLSIDTDAPAGPVVASLVSSRDGGFRGLTTEDNADDLAVAQVNDNGSITNLASTTSPGARTGETQVNLANDVPDGSQLIVTSTDAAGNMTGTYVVLDDSTSTSSVDLSNSNLGNYEINAVELSFADAAQLTITEAQLLGLSDTSNTLTIHGGDDTVNIIGATANGQTVVDNQSYNVFSMGDGTVIIDDDITVNTVI